MSKRIMRLCTREAGAVFESDAVRQHRKQDPSLTNSLLLFSNPPFHLIPFSHFELHEQGEEVS